MGLATCPCGSGLSYVDCCGPFHRGAQTPPTATSLMRSRYCAYVLRDEAYLLRTWHPEHRPSHLNLADDRTSWLGLSIIGETEGKAGDSLGQVEFKARFREEAAPGIKILHETSRFAQLAGSWYYCDGTLTITSEKGYVYVTS